jgi:predicted esterase
MEQFLTSPVRRYYELELPDSQDQEGRQKFPLLIALHGYQGDKGSMMRVARRIARGRMVVFSLQGPHQFFIGFEDPRNRRVGFSWGTTWKMEESVALHHSNLRALINLAARKYHVDRRRIFLLAFSQACSLNYRFVFTHPRKIRGAIGVCGGIPSDWDENTGYRPARTHVLHIAATQDQWYTREKNLEFKRKLAQRAATLDFRFYNSPHRFPSTSIPHIWNWIERHLQPERDE